MSGVRRAFLDRSPGEDRGVVLLDGRPERLLIAREDDDTPRLGAVYGARVEAVSARMGLARLDMGAAPATLRLKGKTTPAIGERLVVEVVAEPTRGKPALVRRASANLSSERDVGQLSAPPDVSEQLSKLGFSDPETGEEAREVADIAQGEALARLHQIATGVDLAIEPTRALTAVDVDLSEAALSPARANLLAIEEAARLLRLKAIGGLIAIDLVGFPTDSARLVKVAERAFAADGPGVSLAGPGRFGLLQVAKPVQAQALYERLLDVTGQTSRRTLAQETVRALQRQARFAAGSRLVAVRHPDVAALAAPLVARLGPMFQVRAEAGAPLERSDILAL